MIYVQTCTKSVQFRADLVLCSLNDWLENTLAEGFQMDF